ncbi:MBL fold metallo-hydrolase [Geotoga petraea]|uniref:MBL fold metallo-hydrolase n=1 Tax=Geotoga petraea TaxID=28234 RepID=A0A1G6MQW5_9BACT|nr:MBL fold metallo-hydrolase [Geotoga petraea]MDK2946187.1 ribonuclease [Geotoga sp.]TGG87376.1 MBL fold metallo-hydrolase [Geotoga petraea]SDC57920.1 RNAse Z [Geotoga petraea]
MEFIIKSKALYTTWIYYKPDRILFDCGEGISAKLGNKIYGIEKIFLSHSHIDHIAGLWGLINTRNNAMGSREKDLTIYYPENSRQIESYLKFILDSNNHLRYKLDIMPLSLFDKIGLKNGRFIEPFKTLHTPAEKSYGYRIIERRNKLKEKYQSFSQNEIIDIVKKYGREELNDYYEANILTVSGDSLPISPEIANSAETLIHECTFFVEEDRKIRNHTSLNELKELIRKSNPKRVIIYHVSSRYNSLIRINESLLREEFPNIDISIIHPEKTHKL